MWYSKPVCFYRVYYILYTKALCFYRVYCILYTKTLCFYRLYCILYTTTTLPRPKEAEGHAFHKLCLYPTWLVPGRNAGASSQSGMAVEPALALILIYQAIIALILPWQSGQWRLYWGLWKANPVVCMKTPQNRSKFSTWSDSDRIESLFDFRDDVLSVCVCVCVMWCLDVLSSCGVFNAANFLLWL